MDGSELWKGEAFLGVFEEFMRTQQALETQGRGKILQSHSRVWMGQNTGKEKHSSGYLKILEENSKLLRHGMGGSSSVTG